ncbi:MAG: hypothetical protein AAAC47_19035, partial [Pararhizobium sp.]
AELEEAKKAIEIQKAELEKSTRNGKTVPVPAENPLPRPVETASVGQTAAKKSFWGGLFSSGNDHAQKLEPVAAPVDAAQQPAAVAGAAGTQTTQKPVEAATQATATTEAAPVTQHVVAVAPASKGFWGRLFSRNGEDAGKSEPLGVTPADIAIQQSADQKPVARQAEAVATTKPSAKTAQKPAAAETQASAITEAAPVTGQVVAEQQPKKRPFWKLWGN